MREKEEDDVVGMEELSVDEESSSSDSSSGSALPSYRFALLEDKMESDDSIDEADLEDLMFGLTESNASPAGRRRRRRRRKRGDLFTSVAKATPTRKSASEPAKTLSAASTLLMQEANNHFMEGHYDQCLQVLTQVIKESPGAHDPYHLMGLIYEIHHQDFKRSIDAYLIAATILRNDIDLWRRIGDMAEELGADNLAIYCYRRVIPPSRVYGPIDEVTAHQIAKLYEKNLDFRRASIYLLKLFVRHRGDSYLAGELVRCFVKLTHFRVAFVIIECFLVSTLEMGVRTLDSERMDVDGEPQRTTFTSVIRGHQWLKDKTHVIHKSKEVESVTTLLNQAILLDDAAAGNESANDAGEEEEQSPIDVDDFELVPLPALDWNLLETYFSLGLQLSENERCTVLGARLLVASASMTADVPSENRWQDYDLYQQLLVQQLEKMPLNILSKFVSCAVRRDGARCRWMSDMVLARLKALNAEPKIAVSHCTHIADSYLAADEPRIALDIYLMIVQDLDRGDGPDGARGEFWLKAAKCFIKLNEYDKAAEFLESLHSTNFSTSISPKDTIEDIVARLRSVEASMLLWKILNGTVDTNAEDVREHATTEITIDNRIRLLIVGSSLHNIPTACIDADTRSLICFRIAVHHELILMAQNTVQCAADMEQWLQDTNVDAIAIPTFSAEVIDLYLAEDMRPLLKHQLVKITELWRALDGIDFTKMSSSSVCQACQQSTCRTKIIKFMSVWRQLICAEYVVLLRDVSIDMRRVLQESSKCRAQALKMQISGFETQVPVVESANALTETAASTEWENDLIIKTKAKSQRDFIRRQHDRVTRGVPASQLILHRTLRNQLGLLPLEDLLGWADYFKLIELGTSLLVQEGQGALAVELLECSLLSIRYSRTLKNPEYARERMIFKTKLKQMILRVAAVHPHLLRVTMSNVRSRIVVPNYLQPNRSRFFDAAIGIYGTLLFSGVFAHSSMTSISASSDRDILAFNRAWITRRLLEQPKCFRLVLLAAHYCTLSMRYAFAVAEYTRAVQLRPANCVASLSLGVATLALSTSRGVQDRHLVVLRGVSAMQRACRVRTAWGVQLCRKLQAFAEDKAVRVVVEVEDELVQHHTNTALRRLCAELDVKLEVQEVLLQSGAWTADKGRILRQIVAHKVAAWLKHYTATLTEYVACENVYNMARAYHHISLFHLAAPLYSEALRRLGQLDIDLEFESVARAVISCGRCAPAISNLIILGRSKFPPALTWQPCDPPCDKHYECINAAARTHVIQWPSTSGGSWRRGVTRMMLAHISSALDITFCKLSQLSLDEARLEPRTKLLLNVRPADQPPPRSTDPDGQPVALTGLYSSKVFLDNATLSAAALNLLDSYTRELPPGVFSLGLDAHQIMRCAAHNWAQISRQTKNYTHARLVQRQHVVW